MILTRPNREILTVAEAAKYLSVGATTIRCLCSSKRLAHLRIGQQPGHGAIRILMSDLQEFARQSREVAA